MLHARKMIQQHTSLGPLSASPDRALEQITYSWRRQRNTACGDFDSTDEIADLTIELQQVFLHRQIGGALRFDACTILQDLLCTGSKR